MPLFDNLKFYLRCSVRSDDLITVELASQGSVSSEEKDLLEYYLSVWAMLFRRW